MWARQLPGTENRWNDLQFSFNPNDTQYDWLAVYDDLPPVEGEKFSQRVEKLPCPPSHSVFITAEPTPIKTYGREFLSQFGTVISSLEPWATPRFNTVNTQPGLKWYYGAPNAWKNQPSRLKTWDQMRAHAPLDKTMRISTVCSDKRMGHALHKKRYDVTQQFKATISELEVFGHGVRDMDDKAEALEAYKYHIAIENHICPHHFTEKLSDAFLGGCLPFYVGAPNAVDYFPADSFIALDIDKPLEAIEIIKSAMARGEYERRLSAILEARRLVLEKYNLFAVIADAIKAGPKGPGSTTVYSRRVTKMKSPLSTARFLLDDVEHGVRNAVRRIAA